jgi:hypothetical protein
VSSFSGRSNVNLLGFTFERHGNGRGREPDLCGPFRHRHLHSHHRHTTNGARLQDGCRFSTLTWRCHCGAIQNASHAATIPTGINPYLDARRTFALQLTGSGMRFTHLLNGRLMEAVFSSPMPRAASRSRDARRDHDVLDSQTRRLVGAALLRNEALRLGLSGMGIFDCSRCVDMPLP